MLTVYCYSQCSTCKKALKWLRDKEIAHSTVDIKTEHPDLETLRKYYAQSGLPLKQFFNTHGGAYRELGLSQKLPQMSEEEQLTLLSGDGMLLRRPILVGEDFVLVGFKEADWADKLLS